MGDNINLPDEAGIAAPVAPQQTLPAQNPPTYTHPVFGPDGQVRDIPADQLDTAIANGGKLGIDLVAPDGTVRSVPVDQAHIAIKQGGRPTGAAATGAAMQTSSAPGFVRGTTSLFPMAGTVAGGAIGAPGVVSGLAGAGAGNVLGSELERGANRLAFGAGENPTVTPKQAAGQIAGEFAKGAATDAGGQVLGAAAAGARNMYGLLAPGADAASQLTRDMIRQTLGSKADADIVENAASRIAKNGGTKAFSTVENELKLVKPQVEQELSTQNSALDQVLATSKATVQNTRHQINTVFDQMVQDTGKSVATQADKDAMVNAINEVRHSVVDRLQNQPTGVQALNDVKRLIGDQTKKFAPPDMLNTAQKAEQEAYRQSYFKLRDLVSQAEPQSATLNEQISRNIDLQALLEKKFPHLETGKAATDSYNAVRKTAGKAVVKELAKNTAIGAAGVGAVDVGDKLSNLGKPN